MGIDRQKHPVIVIGETCSGISTRTHAEHVLTLFRAAWQKRAAIQKYRYLF